MQEEQRGQHSLKLPIAPSWFADCLDSQQRKYEQIKQMVAEPGAVLDEVMKLSNASDRVGGVEGKQNIPDEQLCAIGRVAAQHEALLNEHEDYEAGCGRCSAGFGCC